MQRSGRAAFERLIGVVWEDRVEAKIYRKAIATCLKEHEISKRLGKRPGATAEAVHAAMAAESNAVRAVEPSRETLDKFRRDLSALRWVQNEQQARRQHLLWDWRSAGLLLLAVLTLISAVQAKSEIIFWGIFATFGAWGIFCLSHPVTRRTLSGSARFVTVVPIELLFSLEAHLSGNSWEIELRNKGVQPLMRRIVDALLGDDPDELLLPDSYDGFRATTGHQYVVESVGAEQLARKMNQLDGGTIAVCGPRGSGKTTLLENCVTDEDFSVFIPAPASFTPHDFLISLFIKLCQQYISGEGYLVPDFARLTTTQRAISRFVPHLRKFLHWISYALSALLLIGLGTFATLRSLEKQHGKDIYRWTHNFIHEATAFVNQVWEGKSVGAGLVITALGIITWKSRRRDFFLSFLKNLRDIGTLLIATGLVAVPIVSILEDGQLYQALKVYLDDPTGQGIALALAFTYTQAKPRGSHESWLVRDRRIPKAAVRRSVRFLCFIGFIYACHERGSLRALITDGDNPARMLSILCGVLVYRIGKWRPQPGEPHLVTQCRNQLYRLQTVQGTSSTLNTATSQALSLGSSHTTSITSIPPNFPELVADFRNLLSNIAVVWHVENRRTVIVIDELDRLGSDAQALSFLGEIKAIFGVPYVYYLVSVAEDVGASFVRRGLPYRDATDSSLDDVVHVQPASLDQAKRILEKRAPGISEPYMILVHALSGGIARDLVRYGRRVIETGAKTGAFELTEISRQLILEELLETLSGFRILLSRQEWSEDASPVLESFRKLMAQLRSETLDMRQLRRDLSDFSERRHGFNFSEGQQQLPAETSKLLAEASTYAYFSLTLLDIFGTEGFTRRSEAAEHYVDGDPQLLAETRQELAVSPYTARSLLRSIRRAWNLPVQTEFGRASGPLGSDQRVPGQTTS